MRARLQTCPGFSNRQPGSPVLPTNVHGSLEKGRQVFAGQHVARIPLGENSAAPDQQSSVEDREDLLDMMRDEQDRRCIRFFRQLADAGQERFPGQKIESVRRFVQDQEPGRRHQRPGDENFLLLALRAGLVRAVPAPSAALPDPRPPRSSGRTSRSWHAFR